MNFFINKFKYSFISLRLFILSPAFVHFLVPFLFLLYKIKYDSAALCEDNTLLQLKQELATQWRDHRMANANYDYNKDLYRLWNRRADLDYQERRILDMYKNTMDQYENEMNVIRNRYEQLAARILEIEPNWRKPMIPRTYLSLYSQ